MQNRLILEKLRDALQGRRVSIFLPHCIKNQNIYFNLTFITINHLMLSNIYWGSLQHKKEQNLGHLPNLKTWDSLDGILQNWDGLTGTNKVVGTSDQLDQTPRPPVWQMSQFCWRLPILNPSFIAFHGLCHCNHFTAWQVCEFV